MKDVHKQRKFLEELVNLRNQLRKLKKKFKQDSNEENSVREQANNQNKLILIGQILETLKDFSTSLDSQQAQMEKRSNQMNLLFEGFLIALVASFPKKFKKDFKLLNSIIKFLKKEKNLENNSLASILNYPLKEFD